MNQDDFFLARAIELAQKGSELGEGGPFGAVIVREGKIIAEGWNRVVTSHDPTAHAEMLAITAAVGVLGAKYLTGCSLYVTVEPCVMCAGAIMHARIGRVVFGARDPKTGVAGSVIDLFAETRLNHHAEVEGGLLADTCGGILSGFFAARRKRVAGA